MVTEPGRAVEVVGVHNSDVAGANEASAALQENRTATVREVLPGAVEVGAGDFFRASDADLIGAVGAFAALPPVHEQIIKMIVPRQA